MEPKFQSSFIPKGPAASASPLSAQYSKPKHTLFGFVAGLAFIVSVVLSIGVFGFEKYLGSSISTMGEELEAAKATLQPEVIKELVNADKRIIGTKTLISRHTALSPFFDYLESGTLKSVRFTDFSFLNTAKGIELTMKGQARSYTDVALQSDAFNTSKIFTKPVFSDLDLDAKGNVTFIFHANIESSAISYKKKIAGVTATSTPSVKSSTATSTATSTKPVVKTATSTSTTKPTTQ